MDIPTALEPFVVHHLGTPARSLFCGEAHAQSRVWRLETPTRAAYLKAYTQPRKYRQERHAYEHTLITLQDSTPQLLAHNDAPPALLLSAVPGERGLEHTLNPALHEAAGAFLRRLHNLPFEDSDPLPVAEALRKRAAAWTARAQGKLESDLLEWVQAQLQEVSETPDLRRVPCHRDFTPRNWRFDRSRLWVIDFEHSRPDLALTDIQRLYLDVWLEHPTLKRAFFRGYGRDLSEREQRTLAQIATLETLGTLLWSLEHDDAVFLERGRGWLERLQEVLEQ